ncbi:hypothetical protein V6N11_082037 [Hibiscus sabdariffa]|uniref:Uncharacterized protein n=1 Tax=Hibiscus sabdariffa TaxID=183260 RepID=A0ABR2QGW3_9ROSI
MANNGAKVSVSFAQQEVRNSFWRRCRDISGARIERLAELGQIKRQVCGVVDDVKVQVLQTYAVGWCRQPLSITHLAGEMQSAGFRGIELMLDTGSMELLCFKTMEAIVEGPLSWHNGMW